MVRSLMPKLRQEIRPIGDYPIKLGGTTNTIDLANDYKLDTPYNITDIDSVFNHTDDPDHFVDLFQSYNPTTKIITLSSSVDADKVVWIRFEYEPEVALTTSQEYHEISKIPAIYLTDVNEINRAQVGSNSHVSNKAAGTAVVIPSPIHKDIEITIRGVADSARNHVNLGGELERFFRNNPLLVSKGMDDEFRLWLLSEYDSRTTISQKGVHSGFLVIRIVKALYSRKRERTAYLVKQFKITLEKA